MITGGVPPSELTQGSVKWGPRCSGRNNYLPDVGPQTRVAWCWELCPSQPDTAPITLLQANWINATHHDIAHHSHLSPISHTILPFSNPQVSLGVTSSSWDGSEFIWAGDASWGSLSVIMQPAWLCLLFEPAYTRQTSSQHHYTLPVCLLGIWPLKYLSPHMTISNVCSYLLAYCFVDFKDTSLFPWEQ